MTDNLLHFNSIKVRLEPDNQSYLESCKLFQFHKGTIRTGLHIFQVARISLFQFHKGTIRTKRHLYCMQLDNYFNSIKVRLDPPCSSLLLHFVKAFQFHKGTIRTSHIPLYVYPFGYFNSIKVRLELALILVLALTLPISIP